MNDITEPCLAITYDLLLVYVFVIGQNLADGMVTDRVVGSGSMTGIHSAAPQQ